MMIAGGLMFVVSIALIYTSQGFTRWCWRAC